MNKNTQREKLINNVNKSCTSLVKTGNSAKPIKIKRPDNLRFDKNRLPANDCGFPNENCANAITTTLLSTIEPTTEPKLESIIQPTIEPKIPLELSVDQNDDNWTQDDTRFHLELCFNEEDDIEGPIGIDTWPPVLAKCNLFCKITHGPECSQQYFKTYQQTHKMIKRNNKVVPKTHEIIRGQCGCLISHTKECTRTLFFKTGKINV